MLNKIKSFLFFILIFSYPIYSNLFIDDYIKLNAFNQKHMTMESEHFKLHHPKELRETAEEIANILEKLYSIYKDTYKLTLPNKTDVIISDDDNSGGWAIPFENIMHIWANDFDWNLRGTSNWLENVVAHEYAHVVSIWASKKMSEKIPYIQYGYFTHPNERSQLNAMHGFPNDILPPWFTEGIAQYESTKMKGDSWDSHRDMILRTLTLSGNLISWDHMQVFSADKTYEYELTYNHGFSLVTYIAEKYGQEYLISIIREAKKLPRLNFDRAIKAALGISGKELYQEWKSHLEKIYKKQVKEIGPQIYGKQINSKGFNNVRPRFGPNDSLLYFQSNLDKYSGRANLGTTPLDKINDEKIKFKTLFDDVSSFYDIHNETYRVTFSSMKERKSHLPSNKGGTRAKDLFIDNLPKPGEEKKLFSKKTEQQVTIKKSIFHGAFSPSGDSIAITKHIKNRFVLMLTDSSGSKEAHLYPPKDKPELAIYSIYSIDWSPNGKYIAISYLDRNDRKIGMYEIGSGNFYNICDTKHDERDPKFSNDGKSIYFSSDRTGIFNIYRYNFEKETLERVTNVAGGAFQPDESKDGKKLVYSGFSTKWYKIFHIDSINVVNNQKLPSDSAVVIREGYTPLKLATSNMRRKKYNKTPRDLLVVPMIIGEQILTKENNSYEGISSMKLGAMFQINDPLFWAGKGNSILAYFMLDPGEFIFTKGEIINRKADFDLGLLGYTNALPIDLEVLHLRRGISGRDQFRYDNLDTTLSMDYNLNPSFSQLWLHNYFSRGLSLSGYIDYMNYKVWVKSDLDVKYFNYVPTKGFSTGLTFDWSTVEVSARSQIAPRAKQIRITYNFNRHLMQNEVNSFTFEDGMIKENYVAPYKYHSVTAHLWKSTGIPFTKKLPWLKWNTISFDAHATGLTLTNNSIKELKKNVEKGELPSTEIPSYMEPAIHIPGYTYYYKDTSESVYKEGKPDSYTVKTYTDTALVSGPGLIWGNFSYKFPIIPKSIDKKIGFLYLEYLYGGFNFGGAAAVNSFSDIKELKRKDFLLYRGLELRLSTIAFSSFDLAISARWDNGYDLPKPIGGHRIKLSFDFGFDTFSMHSKNRVTDMKRTLLPKKYTHD